MAFCNWGLWLWRRGLLSCGAAGVERLLGKLEVDPTLREHLRGQVRRVGGCEWW